jgi:hypothetical protein
MLQSSARRPCVRVVAALSLGLSLGLLLAGCSDEKKATPAPAPTPIASLNTVAMQVPRIEFCGLVPKSAVSDALDGTPTSEAAYGNGDLQGVRGIGKDVVHEIGCTWTGKDGATARAWVFARPVDADFARTVIGWRKKGCRTVSGPAYGKPSTTQVCDFSDGTGRVRHAGLFGQTWLTCEVAAPSTDAASVRTRADAWCVQVANALNTAR